MNNTKINDFNKKQQEKYDKITKKENEKIYIG